MPFACKLNALECKQARGTRLGGAQLGGQDAAEAGAAAQLQHAARCHQLRMLRQLPAALQAFTLKAALLDSRVLAYKGARVHRLSKLTGSLCTSNTYVTSLTTKHDKKSLRHKCASLLCALPQRQATTLRAIAMWPQSRLALCTSTTNMGFATHGCQGPKVHGPASTGAVQAGIAHQHRQCAARHTRVPRPSLRAPCRTVTRAPPYSRCCSCASTGFVEAKGDREMLVKI